MSTGLGQRLAVLAGLALLAAVVAVVVVRQTRHHQSSGPEPVGSYAALAGSSGPAAYGRRTSCGGVITRELEGVASPTLPCGARIFVTFGGKTVLVSVVDRRVAAGRQLEVTDALARRLDLAGVQEVHWAYAGSG